MNELFSLLSEDKFFINALLVGLLSSISFGISGAYVVSKRISYVSGAISHCIFGGIGLGIFLQGSLNWPSFEPIYGALMVGIIASFAIGSLTFSGKKRDDTIIGAIWAVGMAFGILFIDITPGYYNLSSYLFGDILLITLNDLYLVVALDVISIFATVVFYRKLMAVCFDPEFATINGINAKMYYIGLITLTSLITIIMVRIVGVIMVIALLTIPAAIVSEYVKKMWQLIVFSIVLTALFILIGLFVSYYFELSSGAVIIVLAGICYLFQVLIKSFKAKG